MPPSCSGGSLQFSSAAPHAPLPNEGNLRDPGAAHRLGAARPTRTALPSYTRRWLDFQGGALMRIATAALAFAAASCATAPQGKHFIQRQALAQIEPAE